ncbi:diguanylate cyclase (GGDEF)-like protein [Onishia taeanensis]|uniref:diguanylate cyclase n=1 Tax=Onishia taeanensis TaxID=284577 RepID=A0A328XK22_9GAMM|nr:GGDEF domain-containing protein [Halomonas taeanensis]RAR59031.1 diguanylate cyclase (GGDEF)-like protein [Halomonas taeanensis]
MDLVAGDDQRELNAMAIIKARHALGFSHRRLLVWVGFLVLVGLAVIAITFYASYAQKQLDADYIAFSSEIVRAQHDGEALRQSSLNLLDHPQPLHQQQLLQALWIINSRQMTIEQYLQRSQLTTQDTRHIIAEFAHLDTLLQQATAIAQDVLEHPEQLKPLHDLTEDIDNSLAYIYSELHTLMMRGATEQQHIMSVMTQIIIALGALVLVVILGLLVAIEKILGQQSALEQLSVTDELTGLENRRAAMAKARHTLALGRRSGASISLAIIDIDHFKRINDQYGHPFGDKVLQQLARTLKQLVRESDVAARIGGEEFCLLMPDTNSQGAYELCERLHQGIDNMVVLHNEDIIRLTVSLGLTTTHGQEDYDFDVLYARADEALYRAKAGGRDRVVVY